jgi:hypothetical protein
MEVAFSCPTIPQQSQGNKESAREKKKATELRQTNIVISKFETVVILGLSKYDLI